MTEPIEAEEEQISWRKINDEPFEYAIQQGPNGDEFVKLLSGSCLRRPAASGVLRTAEQVFTDICDELGCAYDNEAALEAIAKLKAASLPCRDEDAIRLEERERCARELQASYPDHAWLNAACACIRSLKTEGGS